MVIEQGDVFWIDLGEPIGSEPAYLHPYVIVQNDIFNRSRINTIVVCLITSNLKRADAPGNVILKKGEANLSKKCVVNVSQIFTVDKSCLAEKIGSISSKRLAQILEGIRLVLEPKIIDF